MRRLEVETCHHSPCRGPRRLHRSVPVPAGRPARRHKRDEHGRLFGPPEMVAVDGIANSDVREFFGMFGLLTVAVPTAEWTIADPATMIRSSLKRISAGSPPVMSVRCVSVRTEPLSHLRGACSP